jgi:hypothetical protein
MRRAILIVSALGFALFGAGLIISFAHPLLIERAAREVVRLEVEHRVGEKIDSLSNSRIADLALKKLQKTEAEIEQTREALRQELPRKIANVVADMLNADCECRRRLAEHMQRAEDQRLGALVQIRERLTGLIESAYASVTTSLMREFQIFCGSNAVAFAVLGLVTLLRARAALQLALPAIVLLGAVAITGSLYLFSQNWLHTIVFSEYVGFAYLLYLAAVASLLADVVFNRARGTTKLANLALEAVGAAATAVPC